jgi:hypothetical protein
MDQEIDPDIAAQCIDRYCAAWNEPDAAQRGKLLADVWDERSTYTDPTVHAIGTGALLQHIGKVVTRRPGVRIARTGSIEIHHNLALFFWHLVHPDGTFSPEGLDVADLSADGRRILRIIGFFGPLPHAHPGSRP